MITALECGLGAMIDGTHFWQWARCLHYSEHGNEKSKA